jgi:hypothetical protein
MKELVEIRPLVDLKVIKETLERCGIANIKEKILYPSVYVYQNFDSIYIVHFKSMFTLTRPSGYHNLSLKDVERRNSIIFCLQNWGLIEVVNPEDIEPHNEFVYILSHKEKPKWKISHKFNIEGTEITK